LEYIVELKNVSSSYLGEAYPAIRDITLMVKKGDFISIIGPNGAGKTTLLETIIGLIPIVRGKIRIFDKELQKDGILIRRKIGYVPQTFSIDEHSPFIVKDVVLMGRFGKIGMLNSPSKRDLELVNEFLQLLDIYHLKDRPIGKLSGGQQQRVLIARALAKEPELMLLDEPFSAIDPLFRKEFIKKFVEIHKKFDLTTIMVTHDLGSIPEICSKIYVMRGGRIVEELKVEEVENFRERKGVLNDLPRT